MKTKTPPVFQPNSLSALPRHRRQTAAIHSASSAGKLVLSTLSAVAEMERDLLIERTNAGLVRARAEGKTLGRPKVTNEKSAAEIFNKLGEGVSVAQIARDHGVSRMTVMLIRDAAQSNL